MGGDSQFVDYYEVLQLNQNADSETIERVYRLLAKRYHPDNTSSGDEEQFRRVHDAYAVLAHPEMRAQYDVHYDEKRAGNWQIFEQSAALDDQQRDQRIFHGILSLLYAARRRDPESGGLGAVSIEQMLGVPREHLEFPVWYLKKKGLIETLEGGQLAITIAGIDSMDEDKDEAPLPDNRLLNGGSPSTAAPASSPTAGS